MTALFKASDMPTARQCKAMLARLKPGDALLLPHSKHGGRVRYGRVNGCAYAVFGAGGYRLRSGAEQIAVTRLPPKASHG